MIGPLVKSAGTLSCCCAPVAVKATITGAITSILNCLFSVAPEEEVAVTVKVDVEFEPTALAVPPINPFAEVIDFPVGKVPPEIVYETIDSPSGAVALTVKCLAVLSES